MSVQPLAVAADADEFSDTLGGDAGLSDTLGVDASASCPGGCDDGNPCTDDGCTGAECFHVDNGSPCDDGSACTESDVCADGVCHAGAAKPCSDGDECTFDACEVGIGVCVFTAIPGCGAGCTSSAECDDGNPCTQEQCASGKCAFSDASAACDDGDGCTVDTCAAQVGCQHAPKCISGTTCDFKTFVCKATPGCPATCTVGQICDVNTQKCVNLACTLASSWGIGGNGGIQKVSALALSNKIEGCDLDGDGAPNNVMGKFIDLYKDLNNAYVDAIAAGKLVLIFEPLGYSTSGSLFSFNVLNGAVNSASGSCDATADGSNCKYDVTPDSYDLSATSGSCPPVSTFSGAKVANGKLWAGGTLNGSIPILGLDLKPKISNAQVSGTVSDGTVWQKTSLGRICGVVMKSDMEAAIDAMSNEALAPIGDKATVKALIFSILKPDIDVDGDGTKDAISASWDFETVGGTAVGMGL